MNRFASLLTLLLLVSFPLMMAIGCGESSAGKANAKVVIASIDPEGGYPTEVVTTIRFRIETNAPDSVVQWEVAFGDGTLSRGVTKTGEARHTYSQPGRYTISIVGVVEGKRSDPAQVEYLVYSPVDLDAVSAKASPANVEVGKKATFEATVQNRTASPVQTPFEISVYVTQNPSADGSNVTELVSVGSGKVAALSDDNPLVIAPNAMRSVAFTLRVPRLKPGLYYAAVRVDPKNKVSDPVRANNFAVAKQPISVEDPSTKIPDLSVTNLIVAPDRVYPALNSFTRSFDINNASPVDAFDVRYQVFLSVGDSKFDPKTDLLVEEGTGRDLNLGPNETKNVSPKEVVLSSPLVPKAGETLEAWVIVKTDLTGSIVESNLKNNVLIASSPIVVSDTPVTGPDVVVKDFVVKPTTTTINGILQVEATLKNEGTVDVGSFFCGIYVGKKAAVNLLSDPRIANLNLPSLHVGEEKKLTRDIVIPSLISQGKYHMYIVCDPLNVLQEPYRTNNQKIFPHEITVADTSDVDLLVETIIVPPNASDGSKVIIKPRICVHGTTAANPSKGAFFLHYGSNAYLTGEPFKVFDIPTIQPQSCVEIPIEIDAICKDFESVMSFGVVVDTEKVVPEKNENNNTKLANRALKIDGRYCSCKEEASEPNSKTFEAKAAPASPFSGAICTARDCDYYVLETKQLETLEVYFKHDDRRGKLTARLLSGDGTTELSRAPNTLNAIMGVYHPATSSTYYLEVCGVGNDRNLYDVSTVITPAPAKVELVARRSEVLTSEPLSIGATVDVTTMIHNIGATNATSFNIRYVISSDEVIGNADDITLGEFPASPINAQTSVSLKQSVLIPTTLKDGTYWIGVIVDPSPHSLDERDRTNNIAISQPFTVKTECYDPLEPNNRISEAKLVSKGTYTSLTICKGNNDFYRICPPNSKKVQIKVTFDSKDGDLDMELYDDSNKLIDSSTGTNTNTESVEVDYVNGAQCYVAGVKLITLSGSKKEIPYTLDVVETDVDPSLICDSLFEPNDAFATAVSLYSAIQSPKALDRCPASDFDIYSVDLKLGQKVTIQGTKTPATQAGTLRLQLYKPNQLPALYAETAPGIATAAVGPYVAPQAGTYFVQVSVTGSQRKVAYTLSAAGLDGLDLAASNLSIGYGTYKPADDVRYQFHIANHLGTASTSTTSKLYLSKSATLDTTTAVELATVALPSVPGMSSQITGGKFTLPSTTLPGNYTLFVVVADPQDVTPDNNRASTPLIVVN